MSAAEPGLPAEGVAPEALGDWLDGRRPSAPADLRARLDEATASRDGPGGGEAEGADGSGDPALERARALLGAGVRRLDAARAHPGRVRETAFELLVADALVTYACEAALDSERPARALERMLEAGRAQ